MSGQVVPASGLVEVARTIDWSDPANTVMSDAADARTRLLIDGFVHESGPPPARFAWVVLGSHARRELHCASDQDNALFWQTAQAAQTSYAKDLAAVVIEGLAEFGLRRSRSCASVWTHPPPMRSWMPTSSSTCATSPEASTWVWHAPSSCAVRTPRG